MIVFKNKMNLMCSISRVFDGYLYDKKREAFKDQKEYDIKRIKYGRTCVTW